MKRNRNISECCPSHLEGDHPPAVFEAVKDAVLEGDLGGVEDAGTDDVDGGVDRRLYHNVGQDGLALHEVPVIVGVNVQADLKL